MIPLRKHPIFYKQYYYTDLLKKEYQGNERKFIRNMMMFGDMLIHHVHGYLYRIKKFRTQREVTDYFIWVYNNGCFDVMGELEFRKQKDYLRTIIQLYDDK